jgi:AcrR family transcriptional regulator
MEMTDETTYNPTAHKILDTAAYLFMQLGYRAVSINDIVKAAEITKPTLYYYFRDKEELFVQMATQRLLMLNEVLTAAAERDGLAAQLLGMAEGLLDDSVGDMRMVRHEMAEHLSPENQRQLTTAFYGYLFEPVRQVMDAARERGELRNHSSAELTMLFLGVMEAFHGFAGQAGTMALPAHAGQMRSSVFAPNAIVGLFLHGASNIEETGNIQ